jgi:hypothetical protein
MNANFRRELAWALERAAVFSHALVDRRAADLCSRSGRCRATLVNDALRDAHRNRAVRKLFSKLFEPRWIGVGSRRAEERMRDRICGA